MPKSKYLLDVGQRIRRRRKQMELTQLQLADLVGYTSKSRNTTVNKIEAGWSDIPISTAMKFAKVLGVSVEFLLTGKEGK